MRLLGIRAVKCICVNDLRSKWMYKILREIIQYVSQRHDFSQLTNFNGLITRFKKTPELFLYLNCCRSRHVVLARQYLNNFLAFAKNKKVSLKL